MSGFLLDTNAVIALARHRAGPVARRARAHRKARVLVSVIVLHELCFGACRSQQVGRNLAALELLEFPVLPLEPRDARRAAALRAHLAGQGTPIGPLDVLIAGHALARDLTLVTNDTAEFRRLPDLRVEDWSGA